MLFGPGMIVLHRVECVGVEFSVSVGTCAVMIWIISNFYTFFHVAE